MSLVNIVYASAGARTGGGLLPAYQGTNARFENITSSGASQATDLSAHERQFARVTAADGAVWVVAGQDPVAVSGTGWLVLAGTSLDLWLGKGDKIAVVD